MRSTDCRGPMPDRSNMPGVDVAPAQRITRRDAIVCTRPYVSTSTPTTCRSRSSTRRTSVCGRILSPRRARTAGTR